MKATRNIDANAVTPRPFARTHVHLSQVRTLEESEKRNLAIFRKRSATTKHQPHKLMLMLTHLGCPHYIHQHGDEK